MDVLKYTDLDVWLKARQLVKLVYSESKHFPKEELFGLTNQLRRAAISIPSNIAEGCGRQSDKEAVQFFFIAKGSLYEVETQLYLAMDLEYLSREKFENLNIQVEACKKLLNGFIRYFRTKANNQQRTTNN